jgi:uncharacterized membrane protein
MFRQPTEEEKRHPAYRRYLRRRVMVLVVMAVVVLLSLGVGYKVAISTNGLIGGVSFVIIVASCVVIGGQWVGKPLREWLEWRKGRAQSYDNQT